MTIPSSRAAVEVTDLAKSYGPAGVLRGVNLSVRAGEVSGLLGRNGAGKTTALECIVGLRRPDRGSVSLDGIDALRSPVAARERFGAQLQAAALQDKLTPAQALRYFGSFYARSRPVGELLAEFQLEEKAHAPFDSLSGGQRQRLFLALAFVHDPAVVVLDEPTAGLDPQARRELHRCIVAARRRGVAVLLSTHDLDEAEQLCQRVAILHDGRIVASGEPRALIAACRCKPRIIVTTAHPMAAAALGAPDGNILRIVAQSGVGSEPGVTASAAIDPKAAGAMTSTGHRVAIECVDVERALAAVLENLMRAQNRLLEIEIRRPTLEDVFFEHTGTPWRQNDPWRQDPA